MSYIPYAFFSILEVSPGPLGVQVINLLFEFVTVIFVYLITALLLNADPHKQVIRTAWLASCIYLFLPATLWFQSNVYMADMFVQNLWAPALYLSLKIFIDRKEKSPVWVSAFVLSLFLMIYTDWLGVFFAGSVGVTAIGYRWKRNQKSFLPLAVVTLLVSVVTVSLVLFQYSSIAGWNTLMYSYTHRYGERGSLHWGNFSHLLSVIQTIAFNYAVNYLPVLILAVVFLFKRKKVLRQFEHFPLFVSLTLLPVIIDYLLS